MHRDRPPDRKEGVRKEMRGKERRVCPRRKGKKTRNYETTALGKPLFKPRPSN